MAWLIDDIDLSTLAWNISNRSAGWGVPARRGSNLTIPGRHGTQWVANKPFDEGVATLNMWALGSNPDGSMPADGNQRRLCRFNLDKLTALFGQTSRLLNVIQVESNIYGSQNKITNPAFETPNSNTYFTYQNSILNPAGRKTATTAMLTNLFPNPDMSTTVGPGTWFNRFENIFPDPTFQYLKASQGLQIGSSNYFQPSNFETPGVDLSNFNVDAAVTLSVVTTTAADQAANPYGGTHALRALTNAAVPAVNSAICNHPGPFYVAQGLHPAVSFRMRRAAGTTLQTIQMRMFSYQSDLSTRYNYSDYQTVTIPTGTSTWITVNFVPTGGVWASGAPTDHVGFQITNGEAWGSGEGILVDQFICNASDTHTANGGYFQNAGMAGPFWNVGSAWGNLTQDSGSTDDSGIARWNANWDDRWVADPATNANSAYYAFTDRPTGSTVLNFVAMGFTAGQTQGFTLPLSAPTAGHVYSLRFQARAAAGKSCTVKLQKQSTSDANPVTVSSITFTGSGTPVATGSFMSGTINDYVGTGTYTAQAGDQAWVRVEVPTGTDGFPIFQFSTCTVEDSHPFYFSGDSANSSASQYAWNSTQYNSKSILKQQRVSRLATAVQSAIPVTVGTTTEVVARSTCAYNGQPTQLVTENTTIPAGDQGFWINAQLWGSTAFLPVAQPTGQAKIEFLNSAGDVVSTATSSAAVLPAIGATQDYTIRVAPEDVPATATQWRVTALVVNPLAGQIIDLVDLLVMPLAINPTLLGAPSYFDGSTASSAWTSTANNSTSVYNVALPTNWTASAGQLTNGSGINATSPATRTALPQIALSSPLGSASAAGTYLVGAQLLPEALSATGAALASGDVQVIVQALDNSGAVMGTGAAGTLRADSHVTGQPQFIQGQITTTAAFTQLAFWLIASTGVALLQVQVVQAYLMPISNSYTNPTQRLDFNALYNPQLLGDAKGWNTGAATLVTTPSQGNGLRLANSADKVTTNPLYIGPLGQTQTVSYGGVGSGVTGTPLTVSTRAGTIRQNLALDPELTGSRPHATGGSATISYDSKGVKVVSTGNTAAGVYVEIDTQGSTWAKPNHTYTISANWHTDSSASYVGVTPYLALSGSTGVTTTSPIGNPYEGDGRAVITVTLPSSWTSVGVRLMNGSPTVGATVWWSDLLIEDTPGATGTSEVITATNLYPDPSHEYGWGPYVDGVPTSGTGLLSFDTSLKHSGTRSIKYQNTSGNVSTNPLQNPDGATSTYWANAVGTGGAATAVYGGGYAQATWTSASTTSSGFTYSNFSTAFDPGSATAAGDMVSPSVQVWASRAMTITLYRQFMQGGTTLVSGSISVDIPASAWTEIRFDSTTVAPANTDHVRFLIYNTAGMNSGDVLRARYLTMTKADTALPAFSGATADDNFNTYSWSGTANASSSVLTQLGTITLQNLAPRPNPTADAHGWYSSSSTNYTVTRDNTTLVRRPGTWSAKGVPITLGLSTIAGFSYVGCSLNAVSGMIPVTPGQTYTFSVYWAASRANCRPNVLLNWTDDSNVLISTDSTGAVTTTNPANTWARATYTGTAPAGAQYMRPSVTVSLPVSATTVNTDWVRLTDAQFEVGSVASTYIDGSLANSGSTAYAWLSTQDASSSVRYTRVATSTYKTGPLGTTAANVGASNGSTLTLSAWVYVPSGSDPYASQDYAISLYGAAFTAAVLGSTNLTRDAWQKVTISAQVTDATSTIGVRIYGPSYGGDVMWFDDFSLMLGGTTVDVNGDMGTGYRWTGEHGDSSSQRFTPAVNSALGPYFSGATNGAPGIDSSWDGTVNASSSTAFSYVETVRGTIAATTSGQLFSSFVLPSNATHASMSFTGSGATVTSAYMAQPSGAAVDTVQVSYNFFPYVDGAMAVGPYGGDPTWLGTADASATRIVPATPVGWGIPVSAVSVVPQIISATPPAGSSIVTGRPSGGASTGYWAVIPRQTVLNVAKIYRMTPAIQAGSQDFFLSGEILIRKSSGCTFTIDVMMAPSSTATGVVAWSTTLAGSYNDVVSWVDVPVTDAYYYLRISYTETVAAAGYRGAMDNVMLMPTSVPITLEDYPGYFDGSVNGSEWDGPPNASTSTYYGGGRRCYAEVRDAIDMTSMAGGTRAEFSVNLAIPGAFWEDLLESTITQAVTSSQMHANTQFPLAALTQGTAPIDDAVITVIPTGTVTALVLTDVATGATLSLSGNVPSIGVVFDCGAFTAMSGSSSVIRNVTRAGSNGFLPLTPVDSTTPPTLAVSATGTGSLTFTVVARRRFLIA